MRPSTFSPQLDSATAEVLAVPDYLERLDPDSAPGRSRLEQLDFYGPADRSDWRAEVDALRSVGDWTAAHPDAHRELRDALDPIPEIDRALRRLRDRRTLREGDLFDLKQLAFYGRRALETAGPLLASLDPPAGGARRLDRILRTIHPGGGETPRFHLSGELDDDLRSRLDRRREVQSELQTRIDEIGEEITDQLGGSYSLRGRYYPPGRLDEERLRAHPRLEERGGGWRVDSTRIRALRDDLAEAGEELEEAERRVRRELTETLVEEREWLAEVAEFLASLDLRLAKVRLERALDGCWGEWESDGARPALEIRRGRLPHLRSNDDSEEADVQPVDFRLPDGAAVLTGPNMGGKSALLALAGLCQWCAQHACPVPASAFRFRPARSVVYVGSEEPRAVDASRGLSSFGREVRRAVEALEGAERPVLWLLDELGRGTHPEDGAQLAADVLDHLEGRGDRAIAATHFPALADADRFPTFRIRGLSVDEDLGEALESSETIEELEAALSDAMDFQPDSAPDEAVPRDARRVARALGLDLESS